MKKPLAIAILLCAAATGYAQTNTPTPTSTPTNTPTRTPTRINETQNFNKFFIGGDLNHVVSILQSGTRIYPLTGTVNVFGSVTVQYVIPPWDSFTGTIHLRSVDGFSTGTSGNIQIATYVQPGQVLDVNFDGSKWYLQYFAGTPVPSHTPTPTPTP